LTRASWILKYFDLKLRSFFIWVYFHIGMPTHIAAVEVMVSDLKKAVLWYKEVLGFKVAGRASAYKCTQMKLQKDKTVIDLGEPNSEWGPNDHREGQYLIGRNTGIILETDNIERLWKHCQRKNTLVTEPPRKRPWGEIRMRIEDPDGNQITIVELVKRKPSLT